jgi:ATP-dependent exoDNAse (exonuclease V) alpha subunit
MIGSFKPKERENWKTQCIVTDPNEAFQKFIEKKGNHIKVRHVSEDKTFYQVYTNSFTNTDETQCPIYQQILNIEACKLHELTKRIEKKGGIVMHLNTDCVTAMFPDDINPFKCIRDPITNKNNVKGFYYDIAHTKPMYKLEDKDNCPVSERLSKYRRNEVYKLVQSDWNVLNDVEDNNFQPLVDKILDNNMSINIDGLAGTGKSTLIKLLQSEMRIRGISFKSLAPTNKAARVINGQTIHKFIKSHSKKGISEMATRYIFIDEISMVPELFYKYFIVLHRLRPDIKFIIAGDFLQLEPVNDRVSCDYKNSPALFELCDGNRLQLSTCRRSDTKLFNLYHPDNVCNTQKTDFKTKTDSDIKLHLSFTNRKRISVNSICMTEYKNARSNKAKKLYIKKLSYDENSQDMILMEGMPLIARKGNDKLNICNNETFTIKTIDDETITIKDRDRNIDIDIDQISSLFYIAFCITVHKAQGQTYNEPYMLHEWDKFTDRMKYVALSRATNIDHIYIKI